MKKALLGIASAVALTAGLLTTSVAPAQAVQDPAIFFTPHQDDELLSMGASIKEHVDSGRRVIVVLLTDGGNTSVGGGEDNAGALYPTWQQRSDVVTERDREFETANARLGAETEIWAPNGVRAHDSGCVTGVCTGDLTQAKVTAAMQYYKNLYPAASFKTMSWQDTSNDHSVCGYALWDLTHQVWGTKAVPFADARYYVKHTDQVAGKPSGTNTGTVANTSKQNIREALVDYAPIGWLSVEGDFDWEFNETNSAGTNKGSLSMNRIHTNPPQL